MLVMAVASVTGKPMFGLLLMLQAEQEAGVRRQL
jgi:hypothetical protein